MSNLAEKSTINDQEKAESDHHYLTQITLNAAEEIDSYLLGKSHDFSCVQEVARILKKYRDEATDNFMTAPNFPYLKVRYPLQVHTGRTLETFAETTEQMGLFGQELLEDVPNNRGRLKDILQTLVNLSRTFQES
jgi:hypothetical protein